MSTGLSSEGNCMITSPSRLDVICHMFSCCTHQEQLSLLNRLPNYLKRDFIGLLPQELAIKIISYLGPEDVLRNCLLVNKHWYLLLKTCQSYWKAQCKRQGIDHRTLKLVKEKSFEKLTISALKFKHRLSKSSIVKVQNLSIHDYFNDYIIPILPLSNGYFYQHQTLSESSLSLIKFDLTNCTTGQVCATISDPFPNGLLRILWSFSFPNSSILYSNNGRWIKISQDLNGQPIVEEWQDTIYNVVSYRSSACPDCCRIIVMNTSLNCDYLWELQMIQLHSGKTRPTKRRLTFNFMPVPSYKQEPFFTISKIEFIPQPCSCDDTANHRMLVQFGDAVVSTSLMTQGEMCEVFDPTAIFAVDKASYIKFVSTQFTISSDRSLLAHISSECLELRVRDLNNLDGSDCIIRHLCHQKFTNIQCLAVGQLFSILILSSVSDSFVFVVSTRTGNLIQQYSILSTLPYYSDMLLKYYAPGNQEWLNTLEPSLHSKLELCVTVCADKLTKTPQCTLVLYT